MIRTKVPNSNRFSKPSPMKMEIAQKALANALKPKPNYFIECLTHNEDHLEVFYVDTEILESGNIKDSDWNKAIISFAKLEKFADERFTVNSGIINQAETFEDGLRVLVKAYLDAGKELNHV